MLQAARPATHAVLQAARPGKRAHRQYGQRLRYTYVFESASVIWSQTVREQRDCEDRRAHLSFSSLFAFMCTIQQVDQKCPPQALEILFFFSFSGEGRAEGKDMLRWLRGQTAGTQLAENDGWETSGAAEPGHGLGRVAGRKSTVARRLSRALRTSWAPPVVGGRAGDPLEGAHPGWSQPFEAPLCLPRPQTFGAFRCPGTRVLSLAALPDGRIVCGCDDGALLFVLLSCSPHSRAADSEAQGVHDAIVQGQSGLEEAGRCSVANSTIVRLHSAGVTSLQLLPSLRGPCLLASASWDGTVRIWDVSNLGASTCLHVLHLDDATHDAPPAGVRYGLRSVSAATCLAFDPARGALWGGSSTGSITIWSVKCGEVVGLVTQAHDGDVSCTLALQVCDAVASAGADSMIRIWGASCHECLITLMGHTGPVEALGVCAHSMRLFSTSSSDSTIRAWALANEKLDQGFGEEQLEHDCAQTPHDEDVRDRDKGKWWRFWSWGQEDRPETGYGQTTAPGRQACSDAEKQEHGCASREERRRETTCGPLSTLPGHILDLTNPTSLGYITVKEACSAGEGVHGQGGRSDANLRGPPPILDYRAQFGASSSRTGCGGRGSGVHGKENKEPNTEQHWHIRMDTSIEELMSVRYISFPSSTEPGNEFDRQKAQQIPGKVGPHMSMTASTCDKEDLCRVQTGQAEVCT